MIVLRRMGGLLLALPQGYFTAEQLAAGMASPAEDLMGQPASFIHFAGRSSSQFVRFSVTRSCTGRCDRGPFDRLQLRGDKFNSAFCRISSRTRAGSSPASVVFPLPLADFGLVSGSRPRLSRRRWICLLRKRMRHILIVPLNFIHGGVDRRKWDLLGRRPNPVQQRVHQRLWALLATCDTPGGEPFSAVPGRSGSEFEHFAEHSPLLQLDQYIEGPVDFEAKKVGVARPSEETMPFQPYTSLDSSRLKLVGQANWNLADYLHDELWMLFQEPRALHHDGPLDFAAGPDLSRESREENLGLALLWDTKGLLCLIGQQLHRSTFSRVLNARKSAEVDRQISDRRLANQAERHLSGPSKFLPIGYMITGIFVPRGSFVCGAITGRKNLYRQAAVSFEHAPPMSCPSNILLSAFDGSSALVTFLSSPKQKQSRDEVGDQFGSSRRGLLASEAGEV